MSLYNKLFGENPDATILLGMLGLTRNSFGRYRDCFLNQSGKSITVITRIGAANRFDYKDVYENLAKHPNYNYTIPDQTDDTYQYFIFNVPEKYLFTASKMVPKEDWLPVGKRFEKEIEEAKIPGTPAAKRQEEIADWIMTNILLGNTMIDL